MLQRSGDFGEPHFQGTGFLARRGCTGEVVIADNGSTNRSQAIAAANGARVVHVVLVCAHRATGWSAW
jgi:glycosyltransferase involved in cell wall biosynthesis